MMNFIRCWALRAEPTSTERDKAFKIALMENVILMMVDGAMEEDMEGMIEVADNSSMKLIKGTVVAITHSTTTRMLRMIRSP